MASQSSFLSGSSFSEATGASQIAEEEYSLDSSGSASLQHSQPSMATSDSRTQQSSMPSINEHAELHYYYSLNRVMEESKATSSARTNNNHHVDDSMDIDSDTILADIFLSSKKSIAAAVQHATIPLSELHRRCLMASIRSAQSMDDVNRLFVEFEWGWSRYLSSRGQRTELYDAVLQDNIPRLQKVLGSSFSTESDKDVDVNVEFCKMFCLVLRLSRKVRRLPVQQRRQLLLRVHQARNKDEIVQLVVEDHLQLLPLSQNERQVVFDDLLSANYCNLCLANRLDCEENDLGQNAGHECPTCCTPLDDNGVAQLNCCRQQLCVACFAKCSACPICGSAILSQNTRFNV